MSFISWLNMQVSDGQMTPSENAKKSEIKRLFTSTLKNQIEIVELS